VANKREAGQAEGRKNLRLRVPTPAVLYRCEKKGFVRFWFCKSLKTKRHCEVGVRLMSERIADKHERA